ncbi:hypothetical protein TPHA_0C04680 [Tetrapisispora phaffii CBS 4417]|uniref:Translation machinery-associated protein 17 n=1 Tax=Tetrapisispora phaffii (strain ATCC 24235 / CBS 4417 / NBRC 1672 / NRRL Y-8282 / UCD 70-5) TaxID=1071381 RepID=G8BQV6_TETPH|nr:hypothetical protein TPHA_0C04680 [Tetrapisispora phaffii CBS 4417]CCE62618.1 hypothetical protein TPHA_0C04680 [Tetrapisispora phaffii CBS 4417]
MSGASGMRGAIKIEDFKVAIRTMSDGEIEQIKREVLNSLRHLESSTKRLNKYIIHLKGESNDANIDEYNDIVDAEEFNNIDQSDLELFEESVRENGTILDNYNQRIDIINDEQIYRKSGKKVSDSSIQLENRKKGLSTDIDMDNSDVDIVAPNSMYL